MITRVMPIDCARHVNANPSQRIPVCSAWDVRVRPCKKFIEQADGRLVFYFSFRSAASVGRSFVQRRSDAEFFPSILFPELPLQLLKTVQFFERCGVHVTSGQSHGPTVSWLRCEP